MTNITTRANAGRPLTFQEMDDNFINLNQNKAEIAAVEDINERLETSVTGLVLNGDLVADEAWPAVPQLKTDQASLDSIVNSQAQALTNRTVTLRAEKRKNFLTLSDAGARPGIDSTAAIQTAVDSGSAIVDSENMTITASIVMPSLSSLKGRRAGTAFIGNTANVKRSIRKTNNSTRKIKNFQTGVETNVDCVIATNPDWIDNGVSYPQNWNIEGFALQGNAASPNFTAIYHEQGSGLTIRDMQFSDFIHAVYAKEGWSSVIENIRTSGKIVFLGGTSLTFTNVGLGSQGPAMPGGIVLSSVLYSVFNGTWADGTLDSAVRLVNSEAVFNGCGVESGKKQSANSGTIYSFDGGSLATLNEQTAIPVANQTDPLYACGFSNRITFHGGNSRPGIPGVNCPEMLMWGNDSLVIYNDYKFWNGTFDNPVFKFAEGVTTSKIIVRYGNRYKVYYSDGTGTTLVWVSHETSTFTPQLKFGATAVSAVIASGKRQVDEEDVEISGTIQINQNKGPGTGAATISGWSAEFLPVGNVLLEFSLVSNITGGPVIGTINAGNVVASLSSRGPTGDIGMSEGNFTNTTLLWFRARYKRAQSPV